MNIKIVICFIIICLIPVSSAATWDNVWVSRYSAFINSNDSIKFENYQVKATALDNTKASITVFRGPTKIDTVDLNLNDFKEYDTIRVTLLGINREYSWISISKLENKEIWRLLARKQLKWGETYSIENHTINIDTYVSDSVNLTVSNKSVTETGIFSPDGQKDYGDLRIIVTNINRTGFIDLDFFTNKPLDFKKEVIPLIKTEIMAEKDEYFPDEPIDISIKTTSDLPLNVVGITVESSPSLDIKPVGFSASDSAGTLSFLSKISGQPANTTVSISAIIEVRDYLYNSYVINVNRDILITPEVAIIKRVESDTDGDIVPVQLYIYNSASGNRTIRIDDSIPEELNSKELNWTVELKPKMSTTLEYNLTPEKPGLYFLPAAIAQWNGRSSNSRRVKMTSHMPYINMKKTAVINDGKTIVSLVSTNSGDRPAQVAVIDKVPGGAIGDTTWSGKLESGESTSISYSLQGEIATLP
ncbi:MAG: hypothetical protein O8C60_04035, partial [Candidatus Methanoperedens sp.]|nr:hypothetical protein [Candidatus Methanoperedens sp.]